MTSLPRVHRTEEEIQRRDLLRAYISQFDQDSVAFDVRLERLSELAMELPLGAARDAVSLALDHIAAAQKAATVAGGLLRSAVDIGPLTATSERSAGR